MVMSQMGKKRFDYYLKTIFSIKNLKEALKEQRARNR
jgi:hypothetical protein